MTTIKITAEYMITPILSQMLLAVPVLPVMALKAPIPPVLISPAQWMKMVMIAHGIQTMPKRQ